MTLAALDLSKAYTYADYYKWRLEERVELIKGKIFRMSPAPTTAHQRVSSHLFAAMFNYLTDKQCEVFAAPFDVRFPGRSKDDKDIITVLQPDLCVVCDPQKIDDRGCLGAPDLVVEILSAGNHKRELKYKYDIYEEAGVKEYWIADPAEKSVQIYVLTDGVFLASGPLYEEDTATSTAIPGFTVNLTSIFERV